MPALLLSLALLQAPARQPAPTPGSLPTIGDTVWVTRTVQLPAGASVRPRPLEPVAGLQPLGPPVVSVGNRTAEIRYPLVFWTTGRHTLSLPGPILVRSDGWSDTLGAATARIEIESVLPALPLDSIAPAPPAPVLAWSRPSLLPVAVLGLLGMVLLWPVWRWWGRRGPAPGSRAPRSAAAIPLDQWRDAGEHRAVLDAWRRRLAEAADHPRRGELLAQLERARYDDDLSRELEELGAAVAEVTGPIP